MTSVTKFSFGVLAATVLGTVAYVVYLEQLVIYWDRKIDELCAADGGKNVGLRVYERVMAPEHYLIAASGAQPAYVHVPSPYKTPSDIEPIIQKLIYIETLRERNPRVSKFSERIIRVSDGKVLAEETGYMRSRGGLPMPDPADSHTCPQPVLTSIKSSAIYQDVFINHPLNKR